VRVLNIALVTIQRNLKDRKTLIRTLLLPIVLILILGSALNSAFTVTDLGKTTVYYLNSDNGKISKNFDDFLSLKDIKNILEVKKVTSYEEGVNLVNKGEGTALIYIDKNYTKNISDDKKGQIQLYESKSNIVRNNIIESVIDSYNTGANTVMTASKISNRSVGYVTSDNIQDNYLSIEGKSPRAIDYYAVTMLVLTLMYGAGYGCVELDDMFFKNIGKRIRSTQTRTFEHLLGVILGVVFTLLIQALVLVAFTKYVYGANWGSQPFIIFITMFALSVLSTAIGIMLAAIMGDADKAASIIRIIVPIFTFVSGGYFKVSINNSELLNYVPNKLAHSALFNTIYGGSQAIVQQSIITMFVMALVALTIGAIAGRRRFQ
jgi:ABC-2 type transport system permease protein